MSKVWFVPGAGSDAIAMVTPVLEARLKEIQEYSNLSKSTDGSF
jgi:hypothetical protein